MNRILARLAGAVAFAAIPVLAIAGPASAHPHVAGPAHHGAGQVVANGALHAPFINGVECGGQHGSYGIETAHHGPDSGTPGNADGCYQIDGLIPRLDDGPSAIR